MPRPKGATNAEVGGNRDRRDQVGSVEQPDVELVSHVRPGHLAYQFDLEALCCGEAAVGGDYEGGSIGERDEADPEPGLLAAHLNSSAAVITDWATSAILRFSFMAVVRSRA
jgi:hypothetical protein